MSLPFLEDPDTEWVHIDRVPRQEEWGWCCMGAAAMGRCTCWELEFDEPEPVQQEGPCYQRRTMCSTCAYREDSPENQRDEWCGNSPEDLDRVAKRGRFYCHQGMRTATAQVHPSGKRRELVPGQVFAPPPRGPGGRPMKADGSPACLCAGWAARKRRG